MNSEEIRYQQIEDYLKGRLSESEQISFEEQISTDKQLAQEVAVQKVALQSLEMAYIQSMSDLVRNRVQKNNTAKKYWFGGGAILLTSILIGGAYLITQINKDVPAPEKESIQIQKTNTQHTSSVNYDSEIKNSSEENNRSLPQEKITAAPNGVVSVEKTSTSLSDTSLVNKGKINESMYRSSSQKTIPPVETITIEPAKPSSTNACSETAPEVSVRVTPTSLDENTGTLLIAAPANWLVYVKGANTTYEKTLQFSSLAEGTYIVFVKNESNCIYQIGSYAVTNTNCVFEKNYVFNKQFDKEWSIPAQNSSTYRVSILNKAGIEVYSENVAAHSTANWNGLNKNGSDVAIGLHKVIVTYSDNKTCIYNVVVSE
ncbi:hypothetical protein [Cytophaga aurantiaca]|uniref:hypothetical protein n=1 Tax=Cytophaga aurantiaca TaxID=29530 RepID=UPI0003819584|nr:hypothetical protein [Cytophaga aurantiaca]